MKRVNRTRRAATVMLLSACLLGGAGCDEHVTGQLATLTSSYLGDAVSVVVTHYFQEALGVENAEGDAVDQHEHENDAGALHDHEH
jgi:hypothetical protein